GSARNGLLRFKGVPLVYVPWMQFPINNKRHSGFLGPTVGTSTASGASAEIPYYWNIAPNQDATLVPRYLAKRGVQAKTEYRFLTARTGGEIDLEYLDDRVFDDDRALVAANAALQVTPRALLFADYKEVSDDSYFEDLGDSLAITATTHLRRHADLTYFGGPWNLLIRAENYQTVDRTIADAAKPYERVPQVLFDGYWPDLMLGLDYGVGGEWVQFDRDNSVTGDRVDLSAKLSRPVSQAGYFFTPTAQVRHTLYSLENAGAVDPEPQRTLPVLSVDSGLIFERDYAGGSVTQTLEPRLFYLYVPFREQSDIPGFDTGRLDFDFSQLFRTDRFSGADRVGDANQLTAGLTSRLIDFDDGQESINASVGQIYYFRDRVVTLPGAVVETDTTSDLAGQLSLRLGSWAGIGSLLWDPGDSRTQRGTAQLVYRADEDHIVNLAYRLRRDELEQTDFALVWPLTRRWSVLGRWNYSLRESRNLEILAGLEYESCCYKVRLAARRFVADTDGDFNDTFFLQFVFKGLSQLGSPLDKLLERGILGYTADD
ncbi:MAG: LPS-assembly protein LptD, partial [Gammaproteobacteria bacterium]